MIAALRRLLTVRRRKPLHVVTMADLQRDNERLRSRVKSSDEAVKFWRDGYDDMCIQRDRALKKLAPFQRSRGAGGKFTGKA